MAEPVLQVSGLRKSFGALRATDDVSLDLPRGEIHALIGPNGAGKSTLIKLIAGELRADAGGIAFLGRDIGGLGPVARARAGLARSFQVSSVVPEFSVMDNLRLAALGRDGGVMRFLRPARLDGGLNAGAKAQAERMGLADRLEIRAADLSHGERRALEVAMALALHPRALLLDEPMAGMGAEGAAALTQLLADLRHQVPILLVEHDMDAVFALADRITVLDYGRVIASGTVDEIRADPRVRQSYLGDG